MRNWVNQDLQLQYYVQKIDKLQRNIPISHRNPHRLLQKAMNSWEEKDEQPCFEFREISISETLKQISSLAELTALGHDNIDAAAVKTAAQYLVNPLRGLVNLSLKSGNFVQKWKLSKSLQD